MLFSVYMLQFLSLAHMSFIFDYAILVCIIFFVIAVILVWCPHRIKFRHKISICIPTWNKLNQKKTFSLTINECRRSWRLTRHKNKEVVIFRLISIIINTHCIFYINFHWCCPASFQTCVEFPIHFCSPQLALIASKLT